MATAVGASPHHAAAAHHHHAQVAAAAAAHAHHAQQQHAGSAPMMASAHGSLVRMQGLPYSAGVKDILSFFQGYQLPPDGILVLYNLSGQCSGEALVTFPSEELALKAVVERSHHLMLGNPIRMAFCT
ncbi:hypothetical protein NHX12_006052 [Muraenolepis orangiensis]|uniref:RRM domain-containing protein n=1 Tax=Muraenolepis orangiensis TaxID=630683 RepID=A0A9Q0DUB4_9TELE|nr:hypothetical protein NHX12_006052 [Muraenolepis orangiensis]